MITHPTYIIDKQKCKNNINKMAIKAKMNKLVFRPHFKTHQSTEVSKLYREFGVSKITVSSLKMAEFFAADGWDDITLAFPVNVLETPTIDALTKKINLNLLFESVEAVKYVSDKINHYVGAFIKIDTGYKRTGIHYSKKDEIKEIINTIKKTNFLHFKGFIAHAGHTYKAKDANEIANINKETLDALSSLKNDYKNMFEKIVVSIGDTPSCSILESFDGADEIRPGNFVYNDLMQYLLGSCKIKDIATVLACPVVAKHPERNEMIINGGGVHFSKEVLNHPDYGNIYGIAVHPEKEGWGDAIKNVFINQISQEHGTVKAPKEFIENTKVGDIIYFLPVHSCLTANLMKANTIYI